MKKKLLLIAIAGLFSGLASAADLYVRNAGAGGAYSSVSAAITAASNGDRIIIQPKTNGSAYVENLTVNKSLIFMSETQYNKYFIQGTITITPAAGRVVTINNLNSGNFTINDIIISTATSGGRTTLNLYNCFLNNVSAAQANTSVNMSGCYTVGYVMLSHGRCTGNNVQSFAIYNQVTDTSLAADPIEVIGNIVRMGINNQQKDYAFKFLNNFINSGSISSYNVKGASSNLIANNVVYNPNGGDIGPIYIETAAGSSGNIAIYNNIISSSFPTLIQNMNSNVIVSASYNMSDSPFNTSGVTNSNSNFGSAAITIDANNYRVTGANVNAGLPAVDYTDLDLTRNDIGNYGGSNSWDNYWPLDSGGRAQVNYLSTPRAILNTSTLSVTASGYTK